MFVYPWNPSLNIAPDDSFYPLDLHIMCKDLWMKAEGYAISLHIHPVCSTSKPNEARHANLNKPGFFHSWFFWQMILV